MSTKHDAQKDFDFLFGTWRGHNRRLREALAGCEEWLEFECTIKSQPVWGGLANMDEYDAPDSGPWGHIQGFTVRFFDPKSQQWAIYWANRNTGRLDPPMFGGFKDGRGEFYDQEIFRGRAIYSRFIWTPGKDTARWEQAFSDDGAKTWETNWIVDFTRVTE